MTNEQLCAFAKHGDADAQNLLIENNLRFIAIRCGGEYRECAMK